MVKWFPYFQAKLPSVLRIYRDTLTADMKSAIKTTVAELLPVLAARGSESEFFSADRAVDADGENFFSAINDVCQEIDSYIYLYLCFYMLCSTLNFLMLNGDSGGGASLASKLRSLSSDCFVHLLSTIFMIVQVICT